MSLQTDLNLELAWKRFKKDLTDMCFADHPFETTLIDSNLSSWLRSLETKLSNYTPYRSEIINIPKANFHLRPGSNLYPQDAVLYQALILYDIKKIREHLLWSAGKNRFAYILKEDQSSIDWCVYEIRSWSNFREKSLEYFNSGYRYVVFADVAAYFENISIDRLISDLRAIGVEQNVRDCLKSCLYRWAEPRTRGIPQGYRPSFILGEIYFDSIDRRLHNNGFLFCRYVDDLRIFCKTKEDAISALLFLTTVLREKELNLQTAKSFFRSEDNAKEKIDGIAPIIGRIEGKLIEEIQQMVDISFSYATPSFIRGALMEDDKEYIELETVRRAFQKSFLEESYDFDKSLFHYCINRFGAAKDDFAVEYCLGVVFEHPEEFRNILDYFSNLTSQRLELAERLIDFFSKAKHVYDHKIYSLLRWIYLQNLSSEKILTYCREIGWRGDIKGYTRDYAWAILGTFGDASDFDAIEAKYNDVTEEVSKASILCAIRKMVEDRRNRVYSSLSLLLTIYN